MTPEILIPEAQNSPPETKIVTPDTHNSYSRGLNFPPPKAKILAPEA